MESVQPAEVPMRRFAVYVIAAIALIAATPASATGTIECTGVEDPQVTAFVSIGRLPFLAVLSARFEAGGRSWATGAAPGSGDVPAGATPLIFAQGYSGESELLAEFADVNAEQVLVSLRLLRAYDDKSGAEAGLLVIPGAGVWAVTCIDG